MNRFLFKVIFLSLIAVFVRQSAYGYVNPVISTVGPADPTVLEYNGIYYMYPTGDSQTYYAWSSTDAVNWTKGSKVFTGSSTSVWAPEVKRDPATGLFVLYYTDNYSIGCATSSSPTGTFTKVSTSQFPLISGLDACLFVDTDGRYYLFWSGSAAILGKQLTSATAHNGGAGQLLLQYEGAAQSESDNILEGPYVIRYRDTYYMVYSTGNANTTVYHVNYATAKSPLGPWTKATARNPLLQTTGTIYGPGHGCLFTDAVGQWWHMYQQKQTTAVAWDRQLAIDQLIINVDGSLSCVPTRGTSQVNPVTVASDPRPACTLTLPAYGSLVAVGSNVTFTASASDNGSIARVVFYVGDTPYVTNTASPYTATWPAASAGVYWIEACATDNQGALTRSPANLMVVGSPAPTGLSVTAGNNQALLTWTAVPDANSYTVRRGTSPGGPYNTTVATGIGNPAYTDNSVSNGHTYYYVVTATNPLGESAYSSEAALVLGYAVSGTITYNGSGFAGVTVSDGTRSAVTVANGNYTLINVPNGSYTLTPVLGGFTFTPATVSVTVGGNDLSGKNFVATAVAAAAVSENFDSYATGALPTSATSSTMNTGSGWLAGQGWFASTGTSIAANSLTATGYGNSGKRLVITGAGDATRAMAGIQAASGVTWVGFKLHATSTGQSDYISFKNGATESFTMNPAAGFWRFNTWSAPSAPALNTTAFYTVAIRIDPAAAGDTVQGWFNKTSDPTGTTIDMAAKPTAVNFDRLVFNTWGGGFEVDDLKVGFSWAAVSGNAAGTSTALTSSRNPSIFGDAVIYSATIQTNGAATTAATGNVVFYEGATSLGTNGLNNGVAAYTNSTFTAGTHILTAAYAGDAGYGASTSTPLTQTVNQVVTPPMQTILVSGGNAVIRWPTNATGYTLKSNGNLAAPLGSWGTAGTGSMVGTNYEATVPVGAGANFFRLVK